MTKAELQIAAAAARTWPVGCASAWLIDDGEKIVTEESAALRISRRPGIYRLG